MIYYIIFIITIGILLVIDNLIDKKHIGLFTYLAIILTICFVIFRDCIGYDYLQYKWMFSSKLEGITRVRLEPAFVFISDIFNYFRISYYWGFTFFGFASITLLCRAIPFYTSNFRFAFLIYLLIPGLFLNSFSILRQSIAIVLVFNSFHYLIIGKRKSFFLWLFSAFLFHYSAIIVIPFLYLSRKFINHTVLIVIIGIPVSILLAKLNVVSFILNSILQGTTYGVYAGFEDDGTSTIKLMALNSSILFYTIFFKKVNYVSKLFILLLSIAMMFSNIFSSVGALTRIAYYFRICEISIVPNIISTFKTQYIRMLLIIIFVSYFFTQFYNSLEIDTHLNYLPKLTPYKSFITVGL